MSMRWCVAAAAAVCLAAPPIAAQVFKNVTAGLGAQFVHEASPATGNMAGGMAWLDVDGDGDDDLLLTSSSGPHRLLRWDGYAFTDIGVGAGLPTPSGTFGVAVGDYDNDGLPDIYFTNAGPNVLMHNEGGGVFTDVTDLYGIDGGDVMSTSASWADFERDGDIDLYVGNYISGGGVPFKEGTPNRLFVNVGANDAPVFQEVAAALDVDDLGTFGPPPEGFVNPMEGQPVYGNCLSVSTLDFDDDGDADILVGNDFGMFTLPNRLYRNDSPMGGPLAFTDVSEETGFKTFLQFNMGVNGADYDGDGDWDLYLSNLGDNALLQYEDGVYTDVVYEAGPVEGIQPSGKARVSWDTVWFDYDNDGWEDLFVANGYVPGAEDFLPSEIESPNALWRNLGDGTFELSDNPVLENQRLGRGANFTDLDADGQLELSVVNNGTIFLAIGDDIAFTDGAKSYVYRCRPPAGNHWAEFRLKGTRSNVEALGTRLDAFVDGRRLRRQIRSDGVYLTTPSRLVHFGLGSSPSIDRLLIRWPSGTHQTLVDVAAGKLHVIREPDVVLQAVAPPEPSAGALQMVATVANLSVEPRELQLTAALERGGRIVATRKRTATLAGGEQRQLEVALPTDGPVRARARLQVTVVTVGTGAEDVRVLDL